MPIAIHATICAKGPRRCNEKFSWPGMMSKVNKMCLSPCRHYDTITIALDSGELHPVNTSYQPIHLSWHICIMYSKLCKYKFVWENELKGIQRGPSEAMNWVACLLVHCPIPLKLLEQRSPLCSVVCPGEIGKNYITNVSLRQGASILGS